MAYRAEYLWIDGKTPTAEIRSKTKILADNDSPGIWGYDGSSTNQATGDNSDVVLNPVFQCPDPIRGGNDILVMCETLLPDTMDPLEAYLQLYETSARAVRAADPDARVGGPANASGPWNRSEERGYCARGEDYMVGLVRRCAERDLPLDLGDILVVEVAARMRPARPR